MPNIRIINSVSAGALNDNSLPEMPPFITFQSDWLPSGAPQSIECRGDAATVQPFVLDRVRTAVAEGADGIVINCFMDPGLEAAREICPVPIVGPAQSAMTLATTLGERFSVILPAASGEPIVRRQARTYVDPSRLASVRSVSMPVADLHDSDRLAQALIQESLAAIADDGAEVIILGCTGMSYVTDLVREQLRDSGAPILDPTLCAVGSLLSQIIQSTRHSPLGYRLPSWKNEGN